MPRRYLVRLILSSIVLWTLMRGVLVGGGVLAPEPIVSILLVALAVWLIRIDMRYMDEDVFLANLGTDRWKIWSVAAGPAVVLELAASIIVRGLSLP